MPHILHSTATWECTNQRSHLKKKKVTYCKHFFSLLQSLFDFHELKLQYAMSVLLPLKFL